MENTVETGLNRTGQDTSPASKDDMARFAQKEGAQEPATTTALADLRLDYARRASRLGSVPAPMKLRGRVTAVGDTLKGHRSAVLIDKLGERLAFERTGVRLYESLQTKVGAAPDGCLVDRDRLARIRDDEESHFHLLARCLVSLGADPTAVTPCADVAGVSATGALQVLGDPRTTLAQALQAILVLEMTDNVGWDLLAELARECGHPELAESFAQPIDTEREHLETVRGWLRQCVMEEAG